MFKWKPYSLVLAILALALTLLGAECEDEQNANQIAAQARALARGGYLPQNDVEFQNYDDRQIIADDPSTILWCTFFPPTVGQQPFTEPIAGKLTSGDKRPYPTEWRENNSGRGYHPEKPGADGMYGHSGDYRYGFDPTRTTYDEFQDLAAFCTTAPRVWQRNETKIVVEVAQDLLQIHNEARTLLQAAKVIDDEIAVLKKETKLDVPDPEKAAKSAELKAQAMAVLSKAASK